MLLMLFDKVQATGGILKVRKPHSWPLLVPVFVFAVMMLIIGFMYGKIFMTNILTNNLTLVEENNLTQSYDQNNSAGNESSAPGLTIPGILPRAITLEQPKIFTELDVACSPFCNNTNMPNEDFFTGLAKEELRELGPLKIPFLLES